MVTMAAGLTGTAQARPAAVSSAHAPGDLPLTPQFADALGQYRDCVLGTLDHVGLAEPVQMATAAMHACANARDAMRAQLVADIGKDNPGYSQRAAAQFADKGMVLIEPMIAEVARDRAQEQVSRGMQ